MKKQDVILLDLCIDDNQYGFAASALSKAETAQKSRVRSRKPLTPVISYV